MPVLNIPLTSLDAFRFISFRDTSKALAELGITTRQQISDRLGIHIDSVPDMHEMVGPLHIEISCASVIDEDPDHPWVTPGPCPNNAARISVMGCVHEHLVTAPMCDTHLRVSLRQGTAWCGLCREQGAEVAMRENIIDRREHVDAFLLDLLMQGVTTTDPQERDRIEAFIIDNLDKLVAPRLRDPAAA
ncbi:hypothetical protein E1286_05290 [Nonomuraea terrae]|uniref:Uncharacterized protein n=1 Tax=Nonomuraea terrae TaxID=2530383 RepID=A0A4R4ZB56_9ACTN|nr:hypothetical protein [Nonomuraea terrae]TDD54604.1 hypothetical protein E1286_05290 [Nonomuraea terrae]